MENKIGEIITLPDGRKAEVVEQDFCEGCAFHKTNINCYAERKYVLGDCDAKHRTDHKNIIYKEVKDIDLSYEKYLQEKAQLEAYGHTSVITYEEWKKIKEE